MRSYNNNDKNVIWYEEAFSEFPSVIAHEYNRLENEYSSGNLYATLLQIKDTMEVILKFEVLILCAWVKKQDYIDFKQKVECQITTPSMSLGSWDSLAKKLQDYLMSEIKDNSYPFMLDTLIKTRKFYDQKKFISWRNENIGHGALGFADESTFVEDIKNKISEFAVLFDQIGESLKKCDLFSGDVLLDGKDKARGLEVTEDVWFRSDGMEFIVSPYIRIVNGGIYFFDNQKKATRSQLLCYPIGMRKEETIDYFSELDRLRRQLGLNLNEAVSSNYVTKKSEDYLNSLLIKDDFVPPEYLSEWISTLVNTRKKGIYLLKMPRGTGKSCFCEKKTV